jgi:hypothetical protein
MRGSVDPRSIRKLLLRREHTMYSRNVTLVIAGNNGEISKRSLQTDGLDPVTVKVRSGFKYVLSDDDGEFAPENITLRRVNDDLTVTPEGERDPLLVLQGYYAPSTEAVGLYGVAEDGELYPYTPTDGDGGINTINGGGIVPAALGDDSLGPAAPYLAHSEAGSGAPLWPLLLIGAGIAGAAGIALAVSHHGGDNHSGDRSGDGSGDRTPTPPSNAAPVSSMTVHDNAGPLRGIVQAGASIDDATPTLTGCGVPGYTVTIRDGAAVLGTTTVDARGNWSFTPSSALPDGEHHYTATQQGPGTLESSPNDSVSFTVDTVPPAVPNAHVVGALNDAGLVATDRPAVGGTGEPGDTITVTYADGQQTTTTVAADGTWTAPPPREPLPDGCAQIGVTETDRAGNASHADIPVNIDTHAPDVPCLGPVLDDVGPITGPIAPNGTTDDARPTFTGSGAPGDLITVYDNGGKLGYAQIGDDGKWAFTPGTDLAEGPHSATITATGPAGNESAPSSTFDFVTDYTPPDASRLSIAGVYDDVGCVTGNIAQGGTTDDDAPTISGTGTGGDTILVSVADASGMHELGSTTVGADGQWSLQPVLPLMQGANTFTAVEQDPAGNRTAPSAPYAITLADPSQCGGGNAHLDLLNGGHDTLLYRVCNDADPIGGNVTCSVDHFTVGKWETNPEADRIDLADLLIGYRQGGGACYQNGVAQIDPSDHITDYLQVSSTSGGTIVSIDRDGSGCAFDSTPLLILSDVHTDLATLLANHQIVV